MSRWLRLVWPSLVVAALLAGCLFLPAAHADGPHIALSATAGPYQVTVFSAPDPLVTGPVHFTVLVQDAHTGVLLAPVSVHGYLTLSRQAGPASSIPLTLTAAASSNHQLPGQTVEVKAAGTYWLHLSVQAAGQKPQVCTGALSIAKNQGRRNTVLWAVSLLVGFIVLFLANQGAKQRLRAHQAPAR